MDLEMQEADSEGRRTPDRKAAIDLSEFHPPSLRSESGEFKHSQLPNRMQTPGSVMSSAHYNLMLGGMSLSTAVKRQI